MRSQLWCDIGSQIASHSKIALLTNYCVVAYFSCVRLFVSESMKNIRLRVPCNQRS